MERRPYQSLGKVYPALAVGTPWGSTLVDVSDGSIPAFWSAAGPGPGKVTNG